MSKALKPVYSLSKDVCRTIRIALRVELRNLLSWRDCSSEDRPNNRKYVRECIAAIRAMDGYESARRAKQFHSAMTRGMTKTQRRWYRKYKAEKRAEKKDV